MMGMHWPWEHFTQAEMACRHCGEYKVDPDFMNRLEELREAYGLPMIVTSGYRCPDHNAVVSSTGRTGPHCSGRAVDIAVYGERYHRLLHLALDHGFTGIGSHQRGPHGKRFLHLDDLGNGLHPRPWGWTY